MKTYSTEIKNQYGETSEFKITIDENNQVGTMLYLNDEYPLIKCRRSSVTNGVHFVMRIGEYIKLNATLFPLPDQNAFCLLFGNDIPNNYDLSALSYSNLKSFIDHLKLPVANEAIATAYIEREWSDDLVLKVAKKLVCIYIGYLPLGSGQLAKFVNISVNNKEIDISNSYPFPGNQGIIIELGSFDQDNEYLLSWKCEAEYVPTGARAAIGYFINNDLSTRKILKVKDIEPFEDWTDNAKILL
jgi:hypothetical protein